MQQIFLISNMTALEGKQKEELLLIGNLKKSHCTFIILRKAVKVTYLERFPPFTHKDNEKND
jgi:hypothetical protein